MPGVSVAMNRDGVYRDPRAAGRMKDSANKKPKDAINGAWVKVSVSV
jgi:hypothetical protein